MRSVIMLWVLMVACGPKSQTQTENPAPMTSSGTATTSSTDGDLDEPPVRHAEEVKAAPVVVPPAHDEPAPSDPGIFGGGANSGGCKKGCRCGRSCIDCSKTCHK